MREEIKAMIAFIPGRHAEELVIMAGTAESSVTTTVGTVTPDGMTLDESRLNLVKIAPQTIVEALQSVTSL
ncbi:MAG TPA: hypothetical protein VMW41_00270 [Candidatus Bathyarchaeia archaeon]|nr:hypothetical protein [Candidatus Bathyarchaeia archaeon]